MIVHRVFVTVTLYFNWWRLKHQPTETLLMKHWKTSQCQTIILQLLGILSSIRLESQYIAVVINRTLYLCAWSHLVLIDLNTTPTFSLGTEVFKMGPYLLVLCTLIQAWIPAAHSIPLENPRYITTKITKLQRLSLQEKCKAYIFHFTWRKSGRLHCGHSTLPARFCKLPSP